MWDEAHQSADTSFCETWSQWLVLALWKLNWNEQDLKQSQKVLLWITLSDVQIVPWGERGQRAPHREKGEEISSVKNWLLSYRGRWSELGPIGRLEMRMKPEAFLDEADALTWSRVDNNESGSKQVLVRFWGSIGSTFCCVYLLRLFQLWLKSLIPHWSFISWKHQINLALLFL